MTFDSEQALTSQVKILTSKNMLIGGGVLLDKDIVLTCAHVVGDALDIPESERREDDVPDALVRVTFLSDDSQTLDAKILRWNPDDPQDWAILKLSSPAPTVCQVAVLCRNSGPSYKDHILMVHGFPDLESEGEHGIWVTTAFIGINEHHNWQIQSLQSYGIQVQKGFSGCPVWDEANHLVGIVLAAAQDYGLTFLLPANKLASISDLGNYFGIKPTSSPRQPGSRRILQSRSRPLMMQDRDNWLKGHGFVMDPFSPDSDRAENDPLLNDPQHSFVAYVQPGKFNQIPENTYIVISSGGGRTALCQYLKNQYNKGNIDRPRQKTSVIHYSLQRTINITEHIQAINRIAAKGLGVSGPGSSSQMEEAVGILYNLCGQFGYTDLRILVDPALNSQWDELAREAEHINQTGVRFHFFLEKHSFNEHKKSLSLNRFQELDLPLTTELVDLALKCRCEACLKPDINVNAFSLEVLFEPAIRAQVIKTFVQIGVQRQSFRDMWRFGNELFKNHLDENGQAAEQSLITGNVFKSTKEHF